MQAKGVRMMDIKRVGSQASAKGRAEWFTGTVRVDPLFSAPDPARVGGASVTFEPGARTAWHASARPDADRQLRPWLGAARGWARGGDTAGGRRRVPARREALARRFRHHGHDAPRHSRSGERKSG